MRKNGKQWHQPKKAFRPTAGLTSYAKRTEERKAQAAFKAREKEMKYEKEAERQVSGSPCPANEEYGTKSMPEKDTGYQGQTRSQSREGAVRKARRENA
ncbi:MAG: hypothetical protein Q9165_006087 [Trypethelium subeluteriae]